MRHLMAVTAIAAILGLTAGAQALAAGGKNAYNNPIGEPPSDTYQKPYKSYEVEDGGRMLVGCADDEIEVSTTTVDGSVAIICMPDD
jgi:hypothetical protein